MQKSTQEPEESQQLTEKHKNQEQRALQQVQSGESLALIHYINACFLDHVLKLSFSPKYTIFLSHVFLLIFRGNGARDSPVSLDVDIVVMFQQQ